MLVQIILVTIGFIIALSYPIGIEPLLFLPTDFLNALRSTLAIFFLSILYLLIGIYLVKHYLYLLSAQIRHQVQTSESDSQYQIQPRNNRDFAVAQQILTRYHRRLFNYRLLLLLIYFIQVYIFHLPILIKSPPGFSGLTTVEITLITNLLILSPFLLTLILSYIPFYWMERFMQGIQESIPPRQDEITEPTLIDYLLFQIRTYFLLAILPLLVFILFFDLIYTINYLRNLIIIYPFIEWFLSLLLLLVMYISAPFILKYLWVTEYMPEGSLRLYLRSLSYRANVKIRDFLVWKVGQRPFANALLIGLFPFNRFVIFTDTILKNLSDEEVSAVFAHEMGHAKFNHLLILFLFLCAYLSILFFIGGLTNEVLGQGFWNFSTSVLLFMTFWIIIFGQLSRRFELQADWFAVEITGDPDSFTRALTKIAYLNGIPFKTSGFSSFTHPSIEKRITSIRNKMIFSSSQPIMMRRIVAVLIILFVVGLSGVTWTISEQIVSAPQRQLKLKSAELVQKALSLMKDKMGSPALSEEETNDFRQSISYLNTAIKLDPTRPLYYILLGDAFGYLEGEQSLSSRLAYEQAYTLQPTDPIERYYLSTRLLPR